MPNALRLFIAPQTRLRLGYGWNRLRARFLPEPFRTILPYTMVGLPRLRKLAELAKRIDEMETPGDIVECGTCNGGSGALLARSAIASPFGRRIFLLDSFEGLPTPGELDGPEAREWAGACGATVENVRSVLRESGVPEGRVKIVKGWFQDTLPRLEVESIALLHVDADWYDSVRLVLRCLYDKIEPGGFVVLDDYGYWKGCRRAVHEFLDERGIDVALVDVDGFGAYLQKPS
jgi:predicted O-methyltransferase YrrM